MTNMKVTLENPGGSSLVRWIRLYLKKKVLRSTRCKLNTIYIEITGDKFIMI